MSDYRNANDPLQRNTSQDLNVRDTGGALAWIAGAVLVVILAAFAFGINYANTTNNSGPKVASNNAPALNQPPSGPASPAFTPAPMNPSNPMPTSPPPPK
jgi:hypothetical protein